MLKKEDLIKNEVLKTLTEDQIKAIETLSENDENTVISQKTRRDADMFENEIKSITGIEKEGAEKYFDYNKRVLTHLKEKAESGGGSNDEVERLKGEVSSLTEKLKNNSGDEALKSQLATREQDLRDAKTRIAQLETDVSAVKSDYQKKLDNEKANTLKVEVVNKFNQALAGKKPRAGLDEKTFKELIETRQQRLLDEIQPEYVETTSGRVLQFRDKEGNIMTNPENMRHPFTADQLVMKQIGDLLHKDKEQPGGGTTPPGRKAGSTILDIGDASNRQEATRAIEKHLHAKGLTTQDDDYQPEFDKLYKENKVNEMPLGIYEGSES